MPGVSSGVPVNSMPPASKAARTSISVEDRLGGIPSTCSKRLIVRDAIPAFAASSSIDHRNAALADRIWTPVNT